MTSNFTKEELVILSNGLLALINNICEAEKLIYDGKIRETLDKEMEKYQELNYKVCELWGEE